MRNLLVAALLCLALPEATHGHLAWIGAAAAEPVWGAQVAGSFSEATATSAYEALQKQYPDILSGRAAKIVPGVMTGGGTGTFYHVLVPAETRAEAEDFCKRLEAAGGACVVGKMDLSSE